MIIALVLASTLTADGAISENCKGLSMQLLDNARELATARSYAKAAADPLWDTLAKTRAKERPTWLQAHEQERQRLRTLAELWPKFEKAPVDNAKAVVKALLRDAVQITASDPEIDACFTTLFDADPALQNRVDALFPATVTVHWEPGADVRFLDEALVGALVEKSAQLNLPFRREGGKTGVTLTVGVVDRGGMMGTSLKSIRATAKAEHMGTPPLRWTRSAGSGHVDVLTGSINACKALGAGLAYAVMQALLEEKYKD